VDSFLWGEKVPPSPVAPASRVISLVKPRYYTRPGGLSKGNRIPRFRCDPPVAFFAFIFLQKNEGPKNDLNQDLINTIVT
jgi:hypothetical protein